MPEKSVNEVSRPLRELFEKGNVAFQRNNLDYAIEIFVKVLESEPGFYKCRESLRAAQFKKIGVSTGFFKKVMGTASASPMLAKGQMALRSNSLDALNIAEQILNNDPSSGSAHKLLAEAALLNDFPRTAILSLEIVYKSAPKDRKIGMQLGSALLAAGQATKAETVFRDLMKYYPNDQEIHQQLKNVSAQRTLTEQGYGQIAGGDASYRDILRNKEEAEILEQEKKVVRTEDSIARLIYEYEMQLQKEPMNMRLARSIAELCLEQKQYERALEYLDYIKRTDQSADPTLDKLITETKLKKLDLVLEQLDKTDPEYAIRLDELQRQKADFRTAECRLRVDKYPNDVQLRYDLGVAYFQEGKISEAIQEFQRSKEHPNRRIQSLGYLGQCFALRGIFDMSARSFLAALGEKNLFDAEKKELLYQYGTVLEKMGKRTEAMEEFKKIYEVDISYKDVAAKVEKFYSQPGI